MPQPAAATKNAFSEFLSEAVNRWARGEVSDVVRPVKCRPFREVWRLSVEDVSVYLKWFPTDQLSWRQRLKRFWGTDPALQEAAAIETLRKLQIPAPKLVDVFPGLRRNGRTGDALLTWGIEPSEPLDELLQRCRREGLPVPERRELARLVLELVETLARSGYGHRDLHFGNFLYCPAEHPSRRMALVDAYALHTGGLTQRDLLVLGFSARAYATRTELLRGWRRLLTASRAGRRGRSEDADDSDNRTDEGTGKTGRRPLPPVLNGVSRRQWRKAVERMVRPGRGSCGRLRWQAPDGRIYQGLCFLRQRFPHRHSAVSTMTLTPEDYLRELPCLWDELTAETLEPLKRSASSEVWGGEMVLAGVPVDVVIKRAFRRRVYRYVTELGRGTRTWRAWWKSWALIARDIPTAWPLLMLERRTMGVVTDQLLVCERVPGCPLDRVDLDAMSPEDRDRLLRRVGRLLRHIDDSGLVHFDTKASNIVIRPDPVLGPGPVLVDVDGVRTYTWRGEGLRRLLRSMREHHPQFSETDAESLRRGYAPWPIARRRVRRRGGGGSP